MHMEKWRKKTSHMKILILLHSVLPHIIIIQTKQTTIVLHLRVQITCLKSKSARQREIGPNQPPMSQ